MENELLEEKRRFRHAVVYLVKNQKDTVLVKAITTYIPFDQFKIIFNYIGELILHEKLTKLVFDKSTLSVFHQPSMDWYYTEWKDKMFDLGLRTHWKILPKDEVFRQSVKIGREKINKAYPNAKYNLTDIQYFESLQEALKI